MSEAGGLSSSWVLPSCRVLHRQHRQPVRDQDEHEQRDGKRQHERRDLHADRGLDLVAQLDGDGFPEQLHAAGHAGRRDLGAQEECQREHDHRGDRGGKDGVGVDGEPEPFGGLVVADLDGGLGEERVGHVVVPLPSISLAEVHVAGGPLQTVSAAPSSPETQSSPQADLEQRQPKHHSQTLWAGR